MQCTSEAPEHAVREAQFNRIYEDNAGAVHAYIYGRSSDRDLALDLLQETFLRAWRSLSLLRELTVEQQRAWVFTVARNLVTDHYRRQAARSTAYQNLEGAALRSSIADRQEQTDVSALEQAIRDLPEDLRTVLTLSSLAGLTSARIGEVLGKPAGTVRYQLARARRLLARALRQDEEGR